MGVLSGLMPVFCSSQPHRPNVRRGRRCRGLSGDRRLERPRPEHPVHDSLPSIGPGLPEHSWRKQHRQRSGFVTAKERSTSVNGNSDAFGSRVAWRSSAARSANFWTKPCAICPTDWCQNLRQERYESWRHDAATCAIELRHNDNTGGLYAWRFGRVGPCVCDYQSCRLRLLVAYLRGGLTAGCSGGRSRRGSGEVTPGLCG
jgi:hypothetical protein